MTKKDNVKALADLYHVYGNEDSIEGIGDCLGLVCHAHIAQPVERVFPSDNDEDNIKNIYKNFFDSLKRCGCETCSIEARTDDFANDIFDSVKVLKSLI